MSCCKPTPTRKFGNLTNESKPCPISPIKSWPSTCQSISLQNLPIKTALRFPPRQKGSVHTPQARPLWSARGYAPICEGCASLPIRTACSAAFSGGSSLEAPPLPRLPCVLSRDHQRGRGRVVVWPHDKGKGVCVAVAILREREVGYTVTSFLFQGCRASRWPPMSEPSLTYRLLVAL